MSWKNIIKAPTSNDRKKDGSWNPSYRGNRKWSSMHDGIMADIVKDLGLPEDDEYWEYYDDFQLDITSTVDSHAVTINVKPKGIIEIYDGSDKVVHTFTEDKIKLDGSSIEIEFNQKVELDFEFVQYYNGVLEIGLEVI